MIMENKKNTKEQGRLEDKVMSQIRSGRVTLRSKYVFLAETLGLGSAFILSVLISILFLDLIFFYMRETDNLYYLGFGSRGVVAFLESFPYFLVSVFIVFIFAAGYMLKRTDMAYKRSFGYLAAGVVLFVLCAGGALAYTDISQGIERRAFAGEGPFQMFRPFLERGVRPRDKGIAGKILSVESDQLNIQTPFGEVVVDMTGAQYDEGTVFAEGAFIIAVGDREDREDDTLLFRARAIRVVDEEELKMIRRDMERRMEKGGMPSPMMQKGEGRGEGGPSMMRQEDKGEYRRSAAGMWNEVF